MRESTAAVLKSEDDEQSKSVSAIGAHLSLFAKARSEENNRDAMGSARLIFRSIQPGYYRGSFDIGSMEECEFEQTFGVLCVAKCETNHEFFVIALGEPNQSLLVPILDFESILHRFSHEAAQPGEVYYRYNAQVTRNAPLGQFRHDRRQDSYHRYGTVACPRSGHAYALYLEDGHPIDVGWRVRKDFGDARGFQSRGGRFQRISSMCPQDMCTKLHMRH
jgi:hypothetical protein